MRGSLFTGILARPWARRAISIALIVLTIILFLFNLRRTAERAGRASERLENLERTYVIQRQILPGMPLDHIH